MGLMTDVMDAITTALTAEHKSVIVFQAPLTNVKSRVKVTRLSKGNFVLTIGKPNYAERTYLKFCKKGKTTPRRFWFRSK